MLSDPEMIEDFKELTDETILSLEIKGANIVFDWKMKQG